MTGPVIRGLSPGSAKTRVLKDARGSYALQGA
jgi:hypothetical protein